MVVSSALHALEFTLDADRTSKAMRRFKIVDFPAPVPQMNPIGFFSCLSNLIWRNSCSVTLLENYLLIGYLASQSQYLENISNGQEFFRSPGNLLFYSHRRIVVKVEVHAEEMGNLTNLDGPASPRRDVDTRS